MFSSALSFRAVALASAVVAMTFLAPMSAHAAGMERVPTNALGEPMGEHCANPALSYDGRFLVFQSIDEGLVADDRNGVSDVFLFDYETGELVRASSAFLGAFGAGDSVNPAISSDGRYVVFASDASALNLPMDLNQTVDVVDNNGARDVFLYDRVLDQTAAVSVWSDGKLLDGASDRPSVSGDGRVVVFQSRGSTPTAPGGPWRIFAHDRVSGETRMISADEFGKAASQDSTNPVVSADGRYVAFESESALVPRDTNGKRDIYRYDLRQNRVELVSQSSGGAIAKATSRGPAISADGSMIAFESGAPNLVDGDTNLTPDIFVRDLRDGTTKRVSVGNDGEQSDAASLNPRITAAGDAVVFESFSHTITPRSKINSQFGGGERSDVYVHQLERRTTSMVGDGIARDAGTRSGDPAVSGDGTTLVLTELPVRTPPEGPLGEVVGGFLGRIGICFEPPVLAAAIIEVDNPGQPLENIVYVPGETITMGGNAGTKFQFRLDAMASLGCQEDPLEIVLLPSGTGVIPDGMVLYLNPAGGVTCANADGSGAEVLMTSSGVLASAAPGDDLSILFCWESDALDTIPDNGLYSFSFIANYAGGAQSEAVNVQIVVKNCPDGSLISNTTPLPGFDQDDTSPANDDSSPFNGDPLFMRVDVPDPEPNDTSINLFPGEIAEFFIEYAADCPNASLVSITPLITQEVQDPDNCMSGGGVHSPDLPCFLEVLRVVAVVNGFEERVVPNPVFPLTLDQIPGVMIDMDGVPLNGDIIDRWRIEFRASPTAYDAGINIVSFTMQDVSGHEQLSQLEFSIKGCFDAPECEINTIALDGMLVGDGTIDAIDDDLNDAEIGVLDVFANQVLSFNVDGRFLDDFSCPESAITLSENGALPDWLTPVPVLPEVGDPNQAVSVTISGDPDAMDAVVPPCDGGADPVDPVFVVFRAEEITGQASICPIPIRVCPRPECEILIDGVSFADNCDEVPPPTPTHTVIPGQMLTMEICGRQSCGEAGYREITVDATEATKLALAALGWMDMNEFGQPVMDMTPATTDDEYESCVTLNITVPEFTEGFPAGYEDGVFELVFTVTDASGKPEECRITCIVCPPVECVPSDVFVNGEPVSPLPDPIAMGTMAGLIDVDVDVIPGQDNLAFKITGEGGCEGDTLRFDSLEFICFDDMGMPIDIDPAIMGMLEERCVVTDMNDNPVVFPFECTEENMCMLFVRCSLGADLYEICESIGVRATVTAIAEDKSYMQSSTCGVKVRVGQCPNEPVCVIKNFDPPLCTLTGDVRDEAIVVKVGEPISFDVNFMTDCFKFLDLDAMPEPELFFAQLKWSVAGAPDWLMHNGMPLADVLTDSPFQITCEGTPMMGDEGRYEVTFTVMDNTGRMSTCTIVIIVCEGPTCLIVEDTPAFCTVPPESEYPEIVVFPGQPVDFDFHTSSDCSTEGFEGRPILVNWSIKGDVPDDMVCIPAPPAADVFVPLAPPVLVSSCSWTPGVDDVGEYEIIFNVRDNCDRMIECRVVVKVCEPPVCSITEITVDDEVFDFMGAEKPLVPILPGQELKYTIVGTLNCDYDGFLLNLECDDLPTGADVDDTALQTFMNGVTRRVWTVTWTPKVTLDTVPPFEVLYCDELVNFDCEVVATSDCTERVSDLCQLNADVDECPKATCTITTVLIQAGGVGAFVPAVPLEDGCYNVQPGDVVTFDVIGDLTCVEEACNVLLLEQKTQPLPSVNMMMDPEIPVGGYYGAPGGTVRSTFTWTVTDEDCSLINPTVVFNVDQLCGEVSDDCTVCFYVGVCENPPVCELSEFMLRPNPATCFNPNPDEEIPFGDLPFELVDDGYKVYAMPGDTIKLQFCGKTDCLCTTLILDAEGLPDGAVVSCDFDGSGVFVPCDFPVDGEEGIVPYPAPGMPGFRQVCTMVEFTVPPTGSFHITFTVADTDADTADAECVLWVEVEPVCNDFEPNDDCEFPQEILVSSIDPDDEPCGPYLSGILEERVTPGCQPDTYIVLFNKENEIINANNNGSNIGNGKASGLFDITEANGLSEGNGSDRWLRIGVTGFPDGLIKPFNGYPQNGPHGHLGEFEMTITFYDGEGEIISPAIVQDGEGKDVVIDNPYVYTNEFVTGAEAFRLNFQAPRAFQGGGVTASASIEIDNTTGFDPLCNDVDFFKYTGLIPMMDYCITAVGGMSKECTPIDLQLGWFDKQCDLLLLDCDSGPSGVAMLCFVSDVNGEAIVGVTGKGDDDFDGYLVPPPAPLTSDRAVNGCPDPSTDHGVCGCYTLCIMPFDPHSGNLVDRSVESIEVDRMIEAMYHGDMNMDGATDTADLGMLMGRYGWSANDGVGGDRSASVVTGTPKSKSGPVKNGALSGALED